MNKLTRSSNIANQDMLKFYLDMILWIRGNLTSFMEIKYWYKILEKWRAWSNAETRW